MINFAGETSTNTSQNEEFAQVANLHRRRLLQGGFLTAAAAALGLPAGLRSESDTAQALGPKIGFTPIAYFDSDLVHVPEGYLIDVLIGWGGAVGIPGHALPAWTGTASESAEDQMKQYGMHCDGMHFFPFSAGGGRDEENDAGLLVVNHEYADQGLLFSDGMKTWNLDKIKKSQAAHGVSVIHVRKGHVHAKWEVCRPSPWARRISANTPMRIAGPARFQLGESVLGTLLNCAHGYTPWGTYLTCEENWHGCFGAAKAAAPANDPAFAATPDEKRYGIDGRGFGYNWHHYDSRFDLNANRNEPTKFGYVVEIDPFDPASKPVKRTALGRLRHEGAFVSLARDGRIVVYMGDDQVNEYLYKFVSRHRYNPESRHANFGLLDEGILYAAKFHGEGSGEWKELSPGVNGITPDKGFATQGDVCIKTRQAADLAGATKMDRPEWIAVHPKTGEVYCTLTNNVVRTVADPANPRAPNRHGHIIRWREAGEDAAAIRFRWDIFVEAGDPGKGPGRDAGNIQGDLFGSPDGLWFDPDGRLWIQTDILTSRLGVGEYSNMPVNTMLCADVTTKAIKRFLTGPKGCEVTGVITTPGQRTMFVNIQHPGEGALDASDADNPTKISHWPYSQGYGPPGRPRSSTIVIQRKDGGVIGT